MEQQGSVPRLVPLVHFSSSNPMGARFVVRHFKDSSSTQQRIRDIKQGNALEKLRTTERSFVDLSQFYIDFGLVPQPRSSRSRCIGSYT